MNIKLLALLLVTTIGASAAPKVEIVPASNLTHVLKLWRHGSDTPFGTATSASPPQPLVIKRGDLPSPYKTGDLILWVEYTGQPIKKGDLFVFPFKNALTVRPVAVVNPVYIQTVFGTKVAMADVKGTVRRVIRVDSSVKPSA